METYTANKVQTVELGYAYESDNEYIIFNESIKVEDQDGNLLAVFVKQAIQDPELIRIGRDLKRFKKSSSSRGMAMGVRPKDMKVNSYGNRYAMPERKGVSVAAIGFMENLGIYKCRQTMFYRKEKDFFTEDVMKLLNFVSAMFEKHAPEHFARQHAFVESINQNMRLGDTVFTTVTVNTDFRTCTHTDKGDFPEGFGNLLVFKVGDFSGGELLLPEFKIGFHMEEGDLLLFNVHEIHCNNPIKGKGRVSMVNYARKGIRRCDGVSEKELEENSHVIWGQNKKSAAKKKAQKTRVEHAS